MSIFRTSSTQSPRPTDPESLFRDLRDRSAEIRHLWSHQADLLRAYNEKHIDTPNVALELPTGAGKTLVGLLIAEFRRRRADERVVYLCPTRQLARQVGAQSRLYGVAAQVFVGRQSDYPASHFAEFQRGEVIAITTYSGLFNSNPRLNDPHTIVCDDAHAGESFISAMWSVVIDRCEIEPAYEAIVDLIYSDLPAAFSSRLKRTEISPYERTTVELLPCCSLRAKAELLRDALDIHIPSDSVVRYAWRAVRDHLPACQLYITWETILIRPFIPPSLTHLPFQNARQRVYMSATLGEGGELERITGVQAIERLPIPAGWDRQGNGRRLFLLPELSLDQKTAMTFSVSAVQRTERGLFLVPNATKLKEMTESLSSAHVNLLRAQDIEESLEPFRSGSQMALVLANRYDGLDLAGDTCRLLVLYSLPADTNLQESFLRTRLHATSLLRDRFLTRLTQAVGRCTRSDTDFAVVILLGSSIVDFVQKRDMRSLLHPELQAELSFGIRNSDQRMLTDFQTLLDVFLKQTEDWKSAEAEISQLRATLSRARDPAAVVLAATVGDEVRYGYAMWSGRYEDALQSSQSVVDALSAAGLQAYRAWWYYLNGEAALALHEETSRPEHHATAKDRFRRAAICAPAVAWFSHLARAKLPEAITSVEDELLTIMSEGIAGFLSRVGYTGCRFEDRVRECMALLDQTEHRRFHSGLQKLGEMLGFSSEQPPGDGAPDGLWSLGDRLHITHEAKTEQSTGDAIGIGDARQASGHRHWARSNRPCGSEAKIVSSIITPRQSIDRDAVPHAAELIHITPDQIRSLARDAIAFLRSVRAQSSACDPDQSLEAIRSGLSDATLAPDDILRRISSQQAIQLPHQ